MLSGFAMFFAKATEAIIRLFTDNVDFSTIVKAIISSPTLPQDACYENLLVVF